MTRLRPMLTALSRDVAMVADPVDRGRRPRPHLVHPPGRHARPARVRHPARPDRPFPRAAAAVEARAARRRLRREHLDRAHGDGDRPTRSIAVSRGHARGRPSSLRRRRRTRIHVIHNGIDPEFYRARPRDRCPRAIRGRPVGAVRPVRGSHHASEGDRPPRPGHPATSDPGIGVVLCAGQPDTPEIGREMEEGVRAAQAEPAERRLDRRDGEPHRRAPALQPRGGLLLPIGLRAVRDHQPRGGGVRDAGGRVGGGRDPRGRGRRRDRSARSGRALDRRSDATGGRGSVRAQPGRRHQRADVGSRAPAR